ncbi:TPA: PrgI family protein [Streptococcus suis]|nr:PrgI family protein [Streptococcus suis]
MNTRIFKDIAKYQHRAWLGFTTRQMLFVLPALVLTMSILAINTFFWKFGDWFIYTIVFGFTTPMLLLGIYKPQHLFFETYIKYRLNWEMRVPVRTLNGGTYEKPITKKDKIKEDSWEED